MKKPQGLSLFTQQQEINDFFAAFECPAGNGCREVKDCNGDCKKTIAKILVILICLFLSTITYSQTATIKLDNGNYVSQKVVFTSEQQVADHYGLVPTVATYTDIKGNKYKIYTKSENVYYIKETKSGYKKFKIIIK